MIDPAFASEPTKILKPKRLPAESFLFFELLRASFFATTQDTHKTMVTLVGRLATMVGSLFRGALHSKLYVNYYPGWSV